MGFLSKVVKNVTKPFKKVAKATGLIPKVGSLEPEESGVPAPAVNPVAAPATQEQSDNTASSSKNTQRRGRKGLKVKRQAGAGGLNI